MGENFNIENDSKNRNGVWKESQDSWPRAWLPSTRYLQGKAGQEEDFNN